MPFGTGLVEISVTQSEFPLLGPPFWAVWHVYSGILELDVCGFLGNPPLHGTVERV